MSVPAAERGVPHPQETGEQGKNPLRHIVIVGETGVEEMATYFTGEGNVQTLRTPDRVREHFLTNPQVDLLVTTIGVHEGEDRIQGVDVATVVREFYPKALTVLVASIVPSVENKRNYREGFDYMIDRHKLVQQEKVAMKEGRAEFKDLVRAAVQAKEKGTTLPDDLYREAKKTIEQPELKLLAKLDEVKPKRKPTTDEALAVSMSTEEIPEDVIGKLRARKTG